MTTGLAPFPVFRALDANGAPLAGGLLYSYVAGTTTQQATYTDEAGGTPNANPTVLDSTGSANVWLGNLPYKLKLTDSAGNQQWVVDNIQKGLTVSYGLTSITSAVNVTMTNPLNTANVINITTASKYAALPAANAGNSIPVGVPVLIFNKGNAFELRAQDATTVIGAVPIGGAILTLTDNSAANGTWALEGIPSAGLYMTTDAGGGITPNIGPNLGGDLSGRLVEIQTVITPASTPYTITDADRGNLIQSAGAGGVLTATLPDAGTAGNGFKVSLIRRTYNFTVDTVGGQLIFLPNGDFASYTLTDNNQEITLLSDGFNWFMSAGRPDIANPGAANTVLVSNGSRWVPQAPSASLISAYVTFTAATAVIVGSSLNVASVGRFGAGSYIVNFSANYPDTHYAYSLSSLYNPTDATHGYLLAVTVKAVGSIEFINTLNGSSGDPGEISLVIFGT